MNADGERKDPKTECWDTLIRIGLGKVKELESGFKKLGKKPGQCVILEAQ